MNDKELETSRQNLVDGMKKFELLKSNNEIERIICHRLIRVRAKNNELKRQFEQELAYKVKWRFYKKPEWLPAMNLNNCDEILRIYWSQIHLKDQVPDNIKELIKGTNNKAHQENDKMLLANN